MWGEPERAVKLDPCDYLATVLFQVTGPAHIPWQDPRWQELLHGYNVWVHVEVRGGGGGGGSSGNGGSNGGSNGGGGNHTAMDHGSDVMAQACQSLLPNAARSSNLAALSMHVTRMLRALLPSELVRQSRGAATASAGGGASTGTGTAAASVDGVQAFSNRIAVVGKARATAGALNLLRILAHAVIVEASSSSSNSSSNSSSAASASSNYLREVFLYKSRDTTQEQDTANDLIQALLTYIVSVHGLLPNGSSSSSSNAYAAHHATSDQDSATGGSATHTQAGGGAGGDSSHTIPELYDTTVLALQVLTTLLSSQLYQPMISSFQRREQSTAQQQQQQQQQQQWPDHYFWEQLMKQAAVAAAEAAAAQAQKGTTADHEYYRDDNDNNDDDNNYSSDWTPQSLLAVCLDWQIRRPPAPERSIAFHNTQLAESVVQIKGERRGADGMYESHLVVAACAPPKPGQADAATTLSTSSSSHEHYSRSHGGGHFKSNVFLDPLKGVLVLSSSIILLPFRLMSLALSLFHHREKGYDLAHRRQMQASFQASNRTKDVLWITKSPVADLSSSLFLLLTNNDRAGKNPFRAELANLVDNRWEADGNGLPDLPDPMSSYGQQVSEEIDEVAPLMGLSAPAPPVMEEATRSDVLTTNFEALFECFGLTSHTEVGALLLYTFLQASPSFAASIAVRSDLDTLVLPLLRTLYFSSSLRFYAAQDYTTRAARRPSNDSAAGAGNTLSLRNCPFRSQSQLYVIIILLLLFSQDTSFGPDAFRRAMVPNLPWYKERHLKDISLGSVILLCILRSLSFNLNRLQDPFLLSNCCAVLMNLSPSIVDLHEYAAMRLTAVTVSAMKRYVTLRQENPGIDEDDLSSPTAMHGEVSRTLLGVLKHCLSSKNIEHNLHLVYALVYHQVNFKKVLAMKGCPFRKGEIGRIQSVITVAAAIIEETGDARTASKALKALSDNMDRIQEAVVDRRKRHENEDFTFTYEEEADPEIFFVPYVWEVVVCVVTSSSITWDKNRIQIFPLLDDEPLHEIGNGDADVGTSPAIHAFSTDVSDVV